jgi:hypothetical protein
MMNSNGVQSGASLNKERKRREEEVEGNDTTVQYITLNFPAAACDLSFHRHKCPILYDDFYGNFSGMTGKSQP